eukprot:CAMPEP_0172474680 /NCGR_PEP_ID=MMETSP1065-20121228/69484_1 /TAXON_ID=265537 /ORGANISM="Amphiprora paludosa, Strain CCMP125" /LENGTH=221 /DNA_ID=CAMNT_0013232869 /DNA_START=1074 /DNA_END=1735 /DNA_ORIENTATION=-
MAELVLAVDAYQNAVAVKDNNHDNDNIQSTKQKLATLVRQFGVTLVEDTKEKEGENAATTGGNVDLLCSVALFLFGNADQTLPGGYSTNELDENSPIKRVASFPQELVLLGRATVLLKGIAKKLNVSFSLAEQWGPACELTLTAAAEPTLPLWGKSASMTSNNETTGEIATGSTSTNNNNHKIRFRQVASLLKQWGKGKSQRLAKRVFQRLPSKLQNGVLA